jgi:hypothetical protein
MVGLSLLSIATTRKLQLLKTAPAEVSNKRQGKAYFSWYYCADLCRGSSPLGHVAKWFIQPAL